MAKKTEFYSFQSCRSTYPTRLLEEKTKQLKTIKKSIMAAQKCKKYMVTGSTEGFLIPCLPKILKKIKFIKTLTSSGPY